MEMRDWELSNAQTRKLAGTDIGRTRTVNEVMLDAAKEHLVESFAVTGTTERFDETFIALAHVLGWGTTPYEWLRRSQSRVTREELPPSLLEHLVEHNQFDLRLHEFASERLDAALAGVDVGAELRRLHRANRMVTVRQRTSSLKRAALRPIARWR